MAIKVECPHCGEKLHVKDEFAGRKGKCPKCTKSFQVPQSSPVAVGAAVSPAAAARTPLRDSTVIPPAAKHDGEMVLAASATHLFAKQPADGEELRQELESAFGDKITPPRVSLLRKLGIVLVALVLLVLPLFYIAAVAGVAFGMYWLATSSIAGRLPPALFWLFEVFGGLVLVCLIKPLVEPRRRAIQAYPLAADKENLLAEFVSRICKQLDAPPPALIQTECSVHMAAEYRRGMLGLAKRDVVLTIGLPLIACLSAEQFAGSVAVQMAQHRKRAGCRATNFIRAINGWLWRSIFEDGRLDAWLTRVAGRPHFHLAKLLLPLRGAKLVAQAVLFIPMFIGNTVASSLVRLTELDADRASARLVGRDTFASLLVRLGVVEFTWHGVLAELDYLHRESQLPDSLPQQLALRMLDMTPELCEALRDTVATPQEKPFDSRPSDADRQAATQAEPARGVLNCPLPARALLDDYEGLARKVTWDYYVELFGPERLKHGMKPVQMPAGAGA